MGRRRIFDKEALMEAALELVADGGPGAATIAAISNRSGAPVGSIYYRYSSRELLLADLWLSVVEEFQRGLLAEFSAEDAREACMSGASFFCTWVRANPREARLLLLHRREDFISGGWPEEYSTRAAGLKRDLAAGTRALAKRMYGVAGAAEMSRVNFALYDVAYGAVKRYVEAGRTPPPELDELIQTACTAVLDMKRNAKELH